MDAKTLHRVTSKLAFKGGYKSPRELYRLVYDEMDISKTDMRAKTRMLEALRQKRFNEFLGLVLRNTRNRTMLGNQLIPQEPTISKINGLRHYTFDNNTYPSVTTIIKHGKDQGYDVFGKWEEKLISQFGEKVGRRKSKIASKIGDYSHAVIEAYLRGGMTDKSIIERTLAKHLIPFLDEIDEVIAVELPIFSKRGYAGRIDALVRLKSGILAIIDWKTSKQKRTKSNCVDYKCQSAAYALAVYEQYGIKVDEIILAVVYKRTVGKRNPVRHDIIREPDIKTHLLVFLNRLAMFQAKEEILGIDQAF